MGVLSNSNDLYLVSSRFIAVEAALEMNMGVGLIHVGINLGVTSPSPIWGNVGLRGDNDIISCANINDSIEVGNWGGVGGIIAIAVANS